GPSWQAFREADRRWNALAEHIRFFHRSDPRNCDGTPCALGRLASSPEKPIHLLATLNDGRGQRLRLQITDHGSLGISATGAGLAAAPKAMTPLRSGWF